MIPGITNIRLYNFLSALDWNGHIELSDYDRKWLAGAIFDFLNPKKDKSRCDSCSHLQPIVIKTPMGNICEECIELWQDSVDMIREEYDS